MKAMSQTNSVFGGGLALNVNMDLPDEANILSAHVANAMLSDVHRGKGACMNQEYEVQRVCRGGRYPSWSSIHFTM
jgi:hypothetical protein